jgi:hypothetical protein
VLLLEAGEQGVDVVLKRDLGAEIAPGQRRPRFRRRHELYVELFHRKIGSLLLIPGSGRSDSSNGRATKIVTARRPRLP